MRSASPDMALVCPTPRAHGSTLVDAIVGLALRLALAVGLFLWARDNAIPLYDWTAWQNWITPDQGFVEATRHWFAFISAEGSAQLILAGAQILVISLCLGFFARFSGAIVLCAALVYIALIRPEAWSSALIYMAMGLYLAFRGGGPVSLDWTLLRLSRLSSSH